MNAIMSNEHPALRVADLAPVMGASELGRVVVILGGRSSERPVSLKSGAAVLGALKAAGVDAHPFDPAQTPLAELEAGRFDRAFVILHGRFGEDGAIQGVLESLRLPYTGSGIQASALAIDKVMTKRIWAHEGIPTPPWLALAPGGQVDGDSLTALGRNIIVKPAREGSTFGVTKCDAADSSALRAALQEAATFDRDVLVESCIVGRELTCAILGEGASAAYLPLIEIRAPGANYDFNHKYLSNDTQYLCPAPIDDALAARVGSLCVRAYQALGARGWGRVDVMLREEAQGVLEPYLLELNTAPGMTDHSLVPMAARALGIDFTQLVMRLLSQASLDSGQK
jgi:D-alanine-D-alanine ligase